MMSISPRIGKLAALVLLALACWLLATVGLRIAAARVALQSELTDLRSLHEQLSSRRVDLESLRANLLRLTSSSTPTAAIFASSERAALARLQQIARKGVEQVGGQLLGMTETTGLRASSATIATQVRVRIAEALLPRLIANWEQGATRLRLDEFSIASRPRQGDPSSDLEVSVVLRAPWLPQKASAP